VKWGPVHIGASLSASIHKSWRHPCSFVGSRIRLWAFTFICGQLCSFVGGSLGMVVGLLTSVRGGWVCSSVEA
jgi:hypothetical protein